MNVQKSGIVALLRGRGLTERASWLDRDLPEIVDTDKNRGLLELLGVELRDLTPVDAATGEK